MKILKLLHTFLVYFFFSFPVTQNKIIICINNILEAPQVMEDIWI